jgi:hypothetical protein
MSGMSRNEWGGLISGGINEWGVSGGIDERRNYEWE